MGRYLYGLRAEEDAEPLTVLNIGARRIQESALLHSLRVGAAVAERTPPRPSYPRSPPLAKAFDECASEDLFEAAAVSESGRERALFPFSSYQSTVLPGRWFKEIFVGIVIELLDIARVG